MLQTRWQGASFTGQNRVRCPESTFVCEACVWAMAGKPPDTLRMYSHFVDGRGWRKWNKGDKAAMRDWLRAPKRGEWFAAIADSGQKHVLPWAPINSEAATAPRVHFEDRIVTLSSDWSLLDELAELLTLGATKEEIGRGEYGPRAWLLCGEGLRAFEARWAYERGGGRFDLMVWLAQRDETRVQARMEDERHARRQAKGAAAKQDGRGDSRRARRVPAHA
jgi:hypothetical protein